MQVSGFQQPTRTLGKPTSPQPPWKPDDPEGPSRSEVFLEGSKVGLVQFGIPAMLGVLMPGSAYWAGALAGAAVNVARAGGVKAENIRSIVSGAVVGAVAAHASFRFGLLGGLAATGIGALACGISVLQQSIENGHK